MSNNDRYTALARAALLIELDIFGPGASHAAIIDGLSETTARIIADRTNIDSPAGQTALVTLYILLVMLGLQIDLDIPAARVTRQPPLRDGDLRASLLEYAADLLPGGSAGPAAVPNVTFLLGDTAGPATAIRVSGTAWTAAVSSTRPGPRWQGTRAAGAMAAAAAAAADGLRAAIPQIAERLERPAPADPKWHVQPGRDVDLDLTRYEFSGEAAIGKVDAISGGAITTAALYALLRMPVTASIRIIEPDYLDLPNLNRYPLARKSMVTWPKTRVLSSYDNPAIRITGSEQKFTGVTAPDLAPLAPRLILGVDHIPSRWAAQKAAPGWTCVGATSHDYVLVSAHPPGGPCAGCVHPRDEATPGEIPTISFVSFWAGLIQALELAAHAAGRSPIWTRTTHIWPLGLENPRGIHPCAQNPILACPVLCAASAAALSAA